MPTPKPNSDDTPRSRPAGGTRPGGASEQAEGVKQPAGAADFIERLLAGPDDTELTPHDLALLESRMKQTIPLSAVQREKAATGTSPIQENWNKLNLIRHFNRRLHRNKSIDELVSKLYVARPRGLDPELTDAFVAVATAIRECTRFTASVPYLRTDEDEYRRLAACVATAATAAGDAYLTVEIRLRRAGGPNPTLKALNDVMTVQSRAPLDPTGTPGGLNAIITNFCMKQGELFPRIEGQGCIDRMLDQFARVPPATNNAPVTVDPPPAVRPDTASETMNGTAPAVTAETTERCRSELEIQAEMTGPCPNPKCREPADYISPARGVTYRCDKCGRWELVPNFFTSITPAGMTVFMSNHTEERRVFWRRADSPAHVAAENLLPAAEDNGGGAKGVAPPKPKRKRIPFGEANVLVRDWLNTNAKDDPVSITRDAVAAGTGVSKGNVSNSPAWKAFDARRKAESKPGEREVPLTDAMQAVMQNECETPDELAALIEEQEADRTNKHSGHKGRHKRS